MVYLISGLFSQVSSDVSYRQTVVVGVSFRLSSDHCSLSPIFLPVFFGGEPKDLI